MRILDKYLKEYQKNQAEIAPVKEDFVTKVACARGGEIYKTTNFNKNTKKNNISIARTSNKCDKLKPADCESCPACGYHEYKGPGKWCHHRAYFLGKSGQITPIDIAKLNCPLARGCKL